MLFDIPVRFLHAARAVGEALMVLADLGLELLCHEHDHRGALEALGVAPCPDVLPEWMTA